MQTIDLWRTLRIEKDFSAGAGAGAGAQGFSVRLADHFSFVFNDEVLGAALTFAVP